MDAVGRFILGALEESPQPTTVLHALCLGQCNTHWLSHFLVAEAWGQGFPCRVQEGAFDNVLQDLSRLERQTKLPDVLVLLPWHQRLLGPGTLSDKARVEAELDFWQQVWRKSSALGIHRVLQIGYDWVLPGTHGFLAGTQEGGDLGRIRAVNDALIQSLPPSAAFIPLEALSGTLGRTAFYDLRGYYWTKQPFSGIGTMLLARHLLAGLRALHSGPKKVLVVDLDNTLWGGAVGEVGPHGIILGGSPAGEAFCAFQRHLAELRLRGVLLAVCSKNNVEDAREPFTRHPDMILRLSDFAAFEANWEDKASNLHRIAQKLNLGLDSFVFFDDSPAEREQVRQCLPEVAVVDVPEDPADYCQALQDSLWFETPGFSEEDRIRATSYQSEISRREVAQGSCSQEDYWRSLEMVATLETSWAESHVWSKVTRQRVAQLLGKTNQFNLSIHRYSEEVLEKLLAQPGTLALALRLRDRFGDYGLVAVVLALPDASTPSTLYVDSFLVSCRAIGRTVEHCLWNHLREIVLKQGYTHMRTEFVPGAKNAIVQDFWPRMGLTPMAPSKAQEGQGFSAALEDLMPQTTFVRIGD